MSGISPHAVVEAIHIVTEKRGNPKPMSEVTAIAGIGLEWDRYAAATGSYSNWPGNHALTLMMIAAITIHGLRLWRGCRVRSDQ